MPRIVTTTEFKFLTEMEIIYDHFVGKVRKAGEFNYPRGIASHNNGNIFVANPDNHRVQIFTGEGQNVDSFGGKGNLDNQLNFP